MRVPTHADGSALFWEFATDNYDVAFGLFFEWVDHDNETEISVHISDSEDEDLEEDDDEDAVTGMYSFGFEDQEGPEWGRFDVYEAQRYRLCHRTLNQGVIKGGRPSHFLEHRKEVLFQEAHYHCLRQLFLTVSWDLCT